MKGRLAVTASVAMVSMTTRSRPSDLITRGLRIGATAGPAICPTDISRKVWLATVGRSTTSRAATYRRRRQTQRPQLRSRLRPERQSRSPVNFRLVLWNGFTARRIRTCPWSESIAHRRHEANLLGLLVDGSLRGGGDFTPFIAAAPSFAACEVG